MAGIAKQVFAPRHLLAHDDPALTPDVVAPSKFAMTWAAEPSPPIQSPLGHPVERSAVLSSSEADSDLSEREFSSIDKLSQAELSDDCDTSPNHRRCAQQQFGAPPPHDGCSDAPRQSRTFPAPSPSQLEHLQNPLRTQALLPLPTGDSSASDSARFQELSLELADSVEMVVQTLLQVSPTQILDPAKEQYAACSLSVPTSSVSAVLTTMKNLNFVSANMPELCARSGRTVDALVSSPTTRASITHSDFDVGEMLQGVGDALSGCAAQRGVDLVLFHADVGLRHVAVRGEEFGLSNTLTHVIRQVMHTAYPGDAIDVELSIRSVLDGSSEDPTENDSGRHQNRRGSYMSSVEDGQVYCTFQINHYFIPSEASNPMLAPLLTDPCLSRPQPYFGSPWLQQLCSRTGASLACDLPARGSLPGRACQLAFPLDAGSLAAISSKVTPVSDYGSPLLSGARITKEPTLEELIQFSETLRGKKATLCAKESSAFAHHLTSYLTAWGMDVSHVSQESESDGHLGVSEKASSSDNSLVANSQSTKPRHWNSSEGVPHENSSMTNGAPRVPSSGSFVFIDDDVSVLRERIQKHRAEQQPLALPPHSRGKRPSLAAHHRPKSSPQIARALGYGSSAGTQATSPHVIMHFTSLANYKTVRDIVQTDLALSVDAFIKPPLDIMIIPKPAGPRRFLTALHTAVTKPIVDPLFSPIASSPTSAGIHGSPFFNHGQVTPKSPPSRPVYSPRATSDRGVRSPREVMCEPHALHPPSPLAISDTAEYFPDGSVKLGVSPASGLVISSPDGQPAGIVFQPRAKGAKTPGVIGSIELPKAPFLMHAPERVRRPASRRPSSSEDKNPAQQVVSFSALHTQGLTSPNPHRQDSLPSSDAQTSVANSTPKGKARKPSVLADDVGPQPASNWKGNPAETRKTSSPPGSPNTADPPSNVFTRRPSRRAQDQKSASPSAMPSKAAKGATDTNIIPPISVLIVDDNPINQTILSTFMRKKKIKYDVAKNGEEAVQKWRSGGFHLILMDIQMPVMDGIQATKEIRQLEATACAPSTPQSDNSARTPSDVTSSESRTSTSALTSPYRSSVIIVALTASSLQSDRVAALAAGCNDFLTKPVSLQWLNNKIIEWGSIKALQMWADLRPEAAKSISTEQNTQAQAVARRLHVPEGRATPMNHSPSRSSSTGKAEGQQEGTPLVISSGVLPPSQKLDALLRLSENPSTSSSNSGRDSNNKHEGATTWSPIVETSTMTDNADKGSLGERLGSVGDGVSPPAEPKERGRKAAADGGLPSGETPVNSPGRHNEPGRRDLPQILLSSPWYIVLVLSVSLLLGFVLA